MQANWPYRQRIYPRRRRSRRDRFNLLPLNATKNNHGINLNSNVNSLHSNLIPLTMSCTNISTSQSNVNTPQSIVNTSQSTINTSQSTVNTTQSTVNTSQSTVNTSQSTVNTSQSTVNTSQSNVSMPQPNMKSSQVNAGTSPANRNVSTPIALCLSTTQSNLNTSQPNVDMVESNGSLMLPTLSTTLSNTESVTPEIEQSRSNDESSDDDFCEADYVVIDEVGSTVGDTDNEESNLEDEQTIELCKSNKILTSNPVSPKVFDEDVTTEGENFVTVDQTLQKPILSPVLLDNTDNCLVIHKNSNNEKILNDVVGAEVKDASALSQGEVESQLPGPEAHFNKNDNFLLLAANKSIDTSNLICELSNNQPNGLDNCAVEKKIDEIKKLEDCVSTENERSSVSGVSEKLNGIYASPEDKNMNGELSAVHIFRCSSSESLPDEEEIQFQESLTSSQKSVEGKISREDIVIKTNSCPEASSDRSENSDDITHILEGIDTDEDSPNKESQQNGANDNDDIDVVLGKDSNISKKTVNETGPSTLNDSFQSENSDDIQIVLDGIDSDEIESPSINNQIERNDDDIHKALEGIDSDEIESPSINNQIEGNDDDIHKALEGIDSDDIESPPISNQIERNDDDIHKALEGIDSDDFESPPSKKRVLQTDINDDDIDTALEGIDSDDLDSPPMKVEVIQTEGNDDYDEDIVKVLEGIDSDDNVSPPEDIEIGSNDDDIHKVLEGIDSDDNVSPPMKIQAIEIGSNDDDIHKVLEGIDSDDFESPPMEKEITDDDDDIDKILDGIDSDTDSPETITNVNKTENNNNHSVEIMKTNDASEENANVMAKCIRTSNDSESSDDIESVLKEINFDDSPPLINKTLSNNPKTNCEQKEELLIKQTRSESDDINMALDGIEFSDHEESEEDKLNSTPIIDNKDGQLKALESKDAELGDVDGKDVTAESNNDILKTNSNKFKQLVDEESRLSLGECDSLDNSIKNSADEQSTLSSISLKINSENSTDSEKSKFNENVLDIIKSLSSPRHDSNSLDSIKNDGRGKTTPTTSESGSNNVVVRLPCTGLFTRSSLSPLSKQSEDKLSKPSASLLSSSASKRPLESVQSNESEGKLSNGLRSTESSPKRLKREIKPEVIEENKFVEIKNSDFTKFVRGKVVDYCYSKYQHKIQALEKSVAELKETLQGHKHYSAHIRSVMKDLATQQSSVFRQYSYNPKVERRTVGVNVRIHQSSPISNTPSPKDNPIATPPSASPVKPTPTLPKVQIPVLISGNKVVGIPRHASVTSRPPTTSVPLTSSVVVLSTKPSTTTASASLVDLTGDDSPKKPKATLSPKGQLTNLVPLMPSLMQLLPSTSTGPAGNMTIRSQMPRLAYIMPPKNMAGINPPPRLAVARQDGPSGVRQPVQAFVLTPMPVIGGSVATAPRTTLVNTATPTTTVTTSVLDSSSQLTLTPCFTNQHPAPLPSTPVYQENAKLKELPPRPTLKMNKVSNGIVLSWNMNLTTKHADIASYQLYAYQENNNPVSQHLWKKVGDVKALPLPMACTLTQFVEGHKYHFTVRAVDIHKRCGPFSEAASILLFVKKNELSSNSS